MKFEFSQQIFEKYPNIGLDDILFGGGGELFDADGRTDIHDEIKSRRSQFSDRAQKQIFFQPRIVYCISCRSAWPSDGLLPDYIEPCVASTGKYLDVTTFRNVIYGLITCRMCNTAVQQRMILHSCLP